MKNVLNEIQLSYYEQLFLNITTKNNISTHIFLPLAS